MDSEKFDEAVQWAKLVQQLSPSYGTDPVFPFESALRQFARSEGLKDEGELMLEFLEESEDSAWAYDVLKSLVARKFQKRQLDLPDVLWDWAANMIAGKLDRPTKGKLTQPSHNIVIADTVHIVKVRFGVTPTRNRPGFDQCCADGGSACDIVGAAQVGQVRGYSAIQEIWRVYKIFPKACWSEGPWKNILDEWVRRPEYLFAGLPQRHVRIMTKLGIS